MSTLTTLTPRKPFPWSRVFLYVFLVLAAIYFLIPIYVLVITGFKSYEEVSLAKMWNFPTTFTFDSFIKAWQGSQSEGYRGLSGNFINSIMLVIPASILSAFIGSINGYILSKWKFKGSDLIFSLMLFGMFIPYQSILIPLVQVMQWLSRYTGPIIQFINRLPVPESLHWLTYWAAQFIPAYGTIGGLILVHVIYGLPIATLTFRNYYSSISTELIEAALMDGDGMLGIYRHILFPISMPGFVVVLIWQFTSIWNDFLFGIVITADPRVQPMTVALNNLAGSYIVAWNIQMAGALLSSLSLIHI